MESITSVKIFPRIQVQSEWKGHQMDRGKGKGNLASLIPTLKTTFYLAQRHSGLILEDRGKSLLPSMLQFPLVCLSSMGGSAPSGLQRADISAHELSF